MLCCVCNHLSCIKLDSDQPVILLTAHWSAKKTYKPSLFAVYFHTVTSIPLNNKKLLFLSLSDGEHVLCMYVWEEETPALPPSLLCYLFQYSQTHNLIPSINRLFFCFINQTTELKHKSGGIKDQKCYCEQWSVFPLNMLKKWSEIRLEKSLQKICSVQLEVKEHTISALIQNLLE